MKVFFELPNHENKEEMNNRELVRWVTEIIKTDFGVNILQK